MQGAKCRDQPPQFVIHFFFFAFSAFSAVSPSLIVMTVFDDEFAAAALPELFEQFGRSIVFEDPACDPVALTAIVGEITGEEDEAADGGIERRQTREVTITRDQEGEFGGIADPLTAGRLTLVLIDEVHWAIEGVNSQTANLTCLRLVRVGAVEKSRPGYRG